MARTLPTRELKGTGYEIFVGLVSALSLVNLALEYVYRGDADLQTVLRAADLGVSAVFLADFTYRLLTAPSRRDYLVRQYGWADLLSAVPLNELKALRLLRLVRVAQLLRELGFRQVRAGLRRVRAENTLLALLFVGFVVMELGSLQVLAFERDAPEGNIDTASDALWYTLVTISTVGYGDRFPTTDEGRVVGVVLIMVGVGLFAAFTGYLADRFLSPSRASREAREPEPEAGAGELAEAVRQERALEAIRELLDDPATTVDDVGRLVAELSPSHAKHRRSPRPAGVDETGLHEEPS